MPKLRWDCKKSGCFNVERRPKIEVFDDCFPGAIAFGDVDAIVEIDGRVMLLEWKGDGGDVKGGQHIMYSKISKQYDVTVCVVHGNAKTMEIDDFSFYLNGELLNARKGGIMDLKRQLRAWVKKTRPEKLEIDYSLGWLDDYERASVDEK